MYIGIIALCKKSQDLFEQNPERYSDCKMDLYDDETVAAIRLIINYADNDFLDYPEGYNWGAYDLLAKAIHKIWKLKPIKKTFEFRKGQGSSAHNMDYFLDRVEDIFSEQYQPNIDDALRAKVRFNGYMEYHWQYEQHPFAIYDATQQKNERRVWWHSFDNVDCIIHVCALNDYARLLFEDSGEKALEENLLLWEQIVHCKWFRNSKMVVLLNKTDLFRECLKHTALTYCFREEFFGEYKGKNYDDPFEISINLKSIIDNFVEYGTIHIPIDVRQIIEMYCNIEMIRDNIWLQQVYRDGIDFIKQKFVEQRSDISIYETCAINLNEIQNVMDKVQRELIIERETK